MHIRVADERERPKSLTQLQTTTGGVDGPVVDPVSILHGPHPGVVVLMVLSSMVAVGHIKRVLFAVLQAPSAVFVVVVVPSATMNVRRSGVAHREFIDVVLAHTFFDTIAQRSRGHIQLSRRGRSVIPDRKDKRIAAP